MRFIAYRTFIDYHTFSKFRDFLGTLGTLGLVMYIHHINLPYFRTQSYVARQQRHMNAQLM